MATLSDDQIAAYARQAGFAGSNLVTAVAVALAESGGRTDAPGDLGLRTSVWGPSIGLWQIRSLNSQRGTGAVRDEFANLDPAVNARHAFEVAGGGSNWQPWSTFNNGAFRQYVNRASLAVQRIAGGRVVLGIGGVNPNPGAGGAPISVPGLSGGAGGSLFDAFYRVGIFTTLALGGIALVVLGGWRSVSASARQAVGDVPQQGAQVAAVAKMAAA
jgi:hypothetical protein